MVDLRKLRFNRARIRRLLKTKIKPEWADTFVVKGSRLFVNGLEVVASEDVDDWLRARVYNKNAKPFSLSRDSGYTDHVAKETLGISRRKWYTWLASQDIHQRFSVRPKPLRSAGQRLKNFGHCECDLVEVKQKDVPSRTTDTFIFTLIDRLSSYLCAKRVDTKAINPPTMRGTLIVFKELLTEMNAALPTKVHEISMDGGGEFKGDLERYMKHKGIKKKIVPLGAAIEARNGVLQRKLYRLINLGRKGGFDKHLREAVELCNKTTNKVTKVSPNRAVQMKASEVERVFNKFRQKPGKQIGPRLKKGDTVLVMQSHAVKKKGAFYKSYRDHWSLPQKIQKIKGNGIFINGKSVPRNRVKKVLPVDKKSQKILEPIKVIRKAKKKASPPKLRKKSTRAGARVAKAKMKGMK
jgi:hypothetical protein